MLSQLFILSPKGDAIILRDYRGDVPRTATEIFFQSIASDKGEQAPVFHVDGIVFAYIRRNGMYFVATTRFNVSPGLLLELLNRVTRICKDFCGMLTEEALRKNFVLVYELLEEIMDFGYVQTTSTQTIRPFIQNEPVPLEATGAPPQFAAVAMGKLSPLDRKTQPSTAANKTVVSDLSRNEIYVDLLERISVLFARSGEILNAEVDGFIQMKSFLSGQPELRLGLNEDLVIGRANVGSGRPSLVFDDCNFHECLRLEEFEHDRVLSFSPPVGEFTVMNYRINAINEIHVPFRCVSIVDQVAPHRTEVLVKIRAEIPSERYGGNMCLRLPVPAGATGVTCDLAEGAQGQTAEYRASDKQVVWVIRKLQGGSECSMLVKIATDGPLGPLGRHQLGPLSLAFEIPMFSCSNLSVRYLQVSDPTVRGYNPNRWVRCLTQANSYVARV